MKKKYVTPRTGVTEVQISSLLTTSLVQTGGTEGEAAEVRMRGSRQTEPSAEEEPCEPVQGFAGYGSLWNQ